MKKIKVNLQIEKEELKKKLDIKDGVTPTIDYAAIINEAVKKTVEALTPLIPIPEEVKAEKIRELLETLEGEERLDKSAIKGLDEELKDIRNLPRGGGASRRVFQPYRDDFSALTDGTTKIFYLTRAPLQTETAMVFGTDYPTILRPTIDFTITNKTLTLTDQVPAPSAGATLLATYFS